jgi:hypothetical protein
MTRQGGARHWLWRSVLALLVALTLPWIVSGTSPVSGAEARAGDAYVVAHVDLARQGSVPGNQRATLLTTSGVPFVLVAGLDALSPTGSALPAPSGSGHVRVFAAARAAARTVAASRGRSPPAA